MAAAAWRPRQWWEGQRLSGLQFSHRGSFPPPFGASLTDEVPAPATALLSSPASGEGGGMQVGGRESQVGERTPWRSPTIRWDEPSRQEPCPVRAERWASLCGERKERVGELVAICLSVAWLISFGASCSKQKSEGNGLCAKEGFSMPCQRLQFLQRGSRRTLNPATEPSSSSCDVHREVDYQSADFLWSRLLALGQGTTQSWWLFCCC